MNDSEARYRVGIDVGGTFTDVFAFDGAAGRFEIAKVASTPGAQAEGFMSGIDASGAPAGSIETIVHGTTVATNAILERKGAKCGLVATRGFRDALELGRRTRPNRWGLTGSFEALVPRELRLDVTERMDAQGRVVVPLDEDELRHAVVTLRDAGCEALVIHFLHAYANPAHERRAAEIASELWPNAFISTGTEVLSEIREFERASATALNGWVQPLMARYIGATERRLEAAGFGHQLLLMQGNGGMMSTRTASRAAAQTVLSGPAAGAIAAARLGRAAGFDNVLACDMGGTSFDLTLIRDGRPAVSNEKDLAYSVPLHLSLVDIHTIGSGGGSIARVDASGLLRVGPESAGASPGPICYGRGGAAPTVTDANAVLGRIDTTSLAGDLAPADLEQVRARIVETIGKPLGLNAEDAAAAILAVADNQMANAARMVSIEKGHDPREFVLFAFGGAGPMHAAAIARELGIPKVLVPRFPGITSALGCVLADVRHDYVRSLHRTLADVDPELGQSVLDEQAAQGRALIESEGVAVTAIDVVHEADMLYRGQSHVFRVPVTGPGFDPERIRATFAEHYQRRFDIALPEMVPMLVNLRTTVIGRRETFDLASLASAQDSAGTNDPRTGARPVRFNGEWHETSVYDRAALAPGATIEGPAIIEQLDATVPIEPGVVTEVDGFGNLLIPVARRMDRAAGHEAGATADTITDPITLAVVQNGLGQIASEMDLVHQKTSFSPVISEAFDRANGIYDRNDGKIIAQGELGLPIFLGVMQETTRQVIEHKGPLAEGDVIIVNDPYFGGTHLMDVRMVKPFYYRGELWAYLSNTGHWSDTGGMVPGGFCATATEIQQEGLRLPPVHLVRRGELIQDVVDVIMSNIRVPEERLGDMRAQLGALSIGEQRLSALLDKYGEETVSAVIAEMRKRSETLMRAHIESIPDGTYSFSAFVDSDGITDDILEVALDARVEGSNIHFDYSRSSAPVPRPAQLGVGDDDGLHAVRDEAHLRRRAHQLRLLCAHPRRASARDVPLRRVPASGVRLRGGGVAADHGSAVRRARPGDSRAHVRRSCGYERQLQPRRIRSRDRPELRDVHLHRRRLRRLVRRGRHLERDLHHRDLEEPARRGAGAAIPGAVRDLRAARRERRGGALAGRARRELQGAAAARRGEGVVHDGPRAYRPVRDAGRRAGGAERHLGLAGRHAEPPRLRLEGRRLRAGRGGLGAGEHPGRRGLREPGGTAREADRAGRVAGISHAGAG